jgi:hypothetical protein
MAGYQEGLSIRVPEGDKRRVEKYAERHGMSLSEAARRLIDRGLIVEDEIGQEVKHA